MSDSNKERTIGDADIGETEYGFVRITVPKGDLPILLMVISVGDSDIGQKAGESRILASWQTLDNQSVRELSFEELVEVYGGTIVAAKGLIERTDPRGLALSTTPIEGKVQ